MATKKFPKKKKQKVVKVRAHERGESKKKEAAEEMNANNALGMMFPK